MKYRAVVLAMSVAATSTVVACLLPDTSAFTGGHAGDALSGVTDDGGNASSASSTSSSGTTTSSSSTSSSGGPACTADLASDVHNCGACGHDCRGSTCASGRCDTALVATVDGGGLTFGPVIGSGAIFFAESSRLHRVSLSLSTRDQVATSDGVISIGYGGGAVVVGYPNTTSFDFFSADALAKVGTNCCVSTSRSHARPQGAGFLSTIPAGGFIWCQRYTCSGLNMEGQETFVSGQAGPYGIAIDDRYAFWTNRDNGKIMRKRLVASDAGDNGATAISIGEGTPAGISVDADYVAWVTKEGNVVRARKDGTERTVLATTQDGPESILLQDAYIYWTNAFAGTVNRLERTAAAGTAPTVLAQGTNKPWDLAVDATYLYWSEHVVGGRILRVAR